MARTSEYKKKTVQQVINLAKEYPIIGIVNMESLPAQQLQAMRSELRDQVEIFMLKKTLIRRVLAAVKGEKKGVEKLEDYFFGMPALIFTRDSPFKLSKALQKSKTPAPAKAGQIAPNDVIVPAGPTPFAPGPVISELGSAGLEVGVENGKVAVKKDSVVAKKGEKISQKVAEVLTRLDIKPMEVGLGLMAAYEKGIIYEKDVLEVDEQQYLDNVNLAASQAFNLAFNTTWINKDNIELFITKSFNDAKALGIEQNIIDSGVVEELLSKAERSMLSLKGTANIEAVEKPKEEKKEELAPAPEPVKEEPKPEEKKEEPKTEVKEAKPAEKVEEPKVEPVKEEVKEAPKVEEKKEEPKPEPAKEAPSKPEEPVEQPKEEVKESQSSEQKEKDEKEQKAVEDLTKELVQKGTLRK
ncbi:50S ribosomal protein L10 [Candidatus Woesearchaeota archaeon]|nr:50S ribosomal protein L10 [Candidatus Woesearchaeota archaeon]